MPIRLGNGACLLQRQEVLVVLDLPSAPLLPQSNLGQLQNHRLIRVIRHDPRKDPLHQAVE